MKKAHFQKGFTVIEFAVVFAIILALVGGALLMVDFPKRKSQAVLAKALEFSQTAQNAIGDELVGSWPFENVEGGKTPDMSGYNNMGTIYGAIPADGLKLASGAGTGKALSFDGVNDYVDVGDDIGTGNNELTLALWVKPNTMALSAVFIDLWYSGALSYKFRQTKTGRVQGYIKTVAWTGGSFDSSLTVGEWAFVTLVYDGSKIYFYKNGIQDATTHSLTGNVNVNVNNTRIGKSGTNDEFFNGSIDDVCIYSKALTAGEIQKQYAAGLETHQNLTSR